MPITQSSWVSATFLMMFGHPESVLPGLQLVKYRDSPWPACLSAARVRSWGPTDEAFPWITGRGTKHACGVFKWEGLIRGNLCLHREK